MRRTTVILIMLVLVPALFLVGGCGGSDVVNRARGDVDDLMKKWQSVLEEARLYKASFEDVVVTLRIPSEGEEADWLRNTMSQSPPYLIGDLVVANGSSEAIRYYEFAPVLVYAGGFRDEGECTSDFETDMIAPGESLSALFIFSHNTFDGLEKVIISRRGIGEEEAHLVPCPDIP